MNELIKHPTLNMWGTKESLEEWEKASKEFDEAFELQLLWRKCSYCDYTPCRCSKEAIEERRINGK